MGSAPVPGDCAVPSQALACGGGEDHINGVLAWVGSTRQDSNSPPLVVEIENERSLQRLGVKTS